MIEKPNIACISAIAFVFLVLLMPGAASTRPLERHFGTENSCYQRVYSKAHLKKQSTQRVAEIRLDHFPTTFGTYDENDQIRFNPDTGVVHFSLSVRFRGSAKRYSSDGSCYPEGGLYRCQITCDGGSFFLKDRSATSILLINKKGFAVSGCEVEDFRVLEPEPDDKIFRLDRLSGSSCLPPDTSASLEEPLNEIEASKANQIPIEAGWTAYENGLFGWRIDYPANLLKPLPLTNNNAARGFRSTDGTVELIVYGAPNDFGDVERYRKFILGLGRYQDLIDDSVGDDWFVLSGYRANRIYYEKYVFSESREMVHAFVLEYPRDQAELYNEIAAQLSRSFSFHKVVDDDPESIAAAFQTAKATGTIQAWDNFLTHYGHVSDDLHVLAAQTLRDSIADPARSDMHPEIKRTKSATAQPQPIRDDRNAQTVAATTKSRGQVGEWTNFTINKGAYVAIPGWGDVLVRPECTDDLQIWRFFFSHTRGDLRTRLRFEVLYPHVTVNLPESMVPMKFEVTFGTDRESWKEFTGKPDIPCADEVQMRFFDLEWFTAMGRPLANQ